MQIFDIWNNIKFGRLVEKVTEYIYSTSIQFTEQYSNVATLLGCYRQMNANL